MGKYKENPRYNVLSLRVSDQIYFDVVSALNGRTVADYLAAAIEEKLIRDRQLALDEHLRANGL